ncbi:MAG TPA: TlpA disulfide reductase family protein [Burkholderiales bacterium]|nr:TlpA disulfide reductase family protein [Burkholderiales bacterium]
MLKSAHWFVMTPARREFLTLSAVAAGAALLGGLVGALALQSGTGAADLLASRYPDLSGRIRALSEWQGRRLVCNFWAPWCEPCRDELPLLDAAWRQYAPRRLEFVGIAIDTAPNVREYLKVVNIGYPVLVGEAGALGLMRSLGNKAAALPFTVLLDAAGRVRQTKLGAFTGPELDSGIAALLR